jgi:hypothetical protein
MLSNSIASGNSRKINRSEIILEDVSRYSRFNEVEQTAGNWADTKDGVSIWFQDFAGLNALLGERRWAGFYWRKLMA